MDSLTEHFNRQADYLNRQVYYLIFLLWIFGALDYSARLEKRRRKRNLKLSREFNEKDMKKLRETYSRQVAERHMPRSYRPPAPRF